MHLEHLNTILFLLQFAGIVLGTEWQPFHTNVTGLLSSDGIAEESSETETLCVGWMDTHTDANVVCYKEKEKLCVGHRINIPSTSTSDNAEEWNCYSEYKTKFK